jgi:arylsulfatase A-like enzyme
VAWLTLGCDAGSQHRPRVLDLLAGESMLRPVVWPGTGRSQASPQVVAEWSFEKPSLAHWQIATHRGKARKYRSFIEGSGSGAALCIESREGAAEADARTHVAVWPGTTYRLEGKLRSYDLSPETAEVYGTIFLGELDYLGANTRGENDATRWHRDLPMLAGTSEGWEEVRYEFRTQTGTRMLRIAASLGNWGTASGKLCIDQLRLVEVAPPAQGEPATLVQQSLVAGELRRALRADPPSVYRAALIVPERARLRFAIGIEDIGRAEGADGVRFDVELSSRKVVHSLYTHHVTRSDVWIAADVSLEAYAGQEVELIFRTSRSRQGLHPPSPSRDLAVWAHPKVWTPRSAADRETAPDVILVTVDTLRADHLSCYGYLRNTSPSIDALAADGILFDNAFTTVPRTTPALASLMTGDYPRKHGLMTLLDALSSEKRTLAEVLSEQGYATAAFVTPSVHRQSALWQGFDVFDDRMDSDDRKARAEQMAARALRWLDEHRGERLFLWLHLWDPHFRYDPPAPHDEAFDPQTGERPSLYRRIDRGELKLGELYFENDLAKEEVAQLVAQYDGEIRYADSVIGQFLDRLRDLSLYAPALVVFTADHGESLGEHGYYFEHGEYLYDASLRIPLILKLPLGRRAGSRITDPAMIFDVAPTVLSILSLEERLGSPGRDLSSASRSGEPLRETIFHETGRRFFAQNPRRHLDGPAGHWKSVRAGDWKLIRIPTPDGDIHELYDLGEDPGETRNLFREDDPVGRDLAKKLDAWLAGFGEVTEGDGTSDAIDPATAERLRALGYLD